MAVTFFERRGWVVGSKPSKDLCPGCRSARRQDHQARRAHRESADIQETVTMAKPHIPVAVDAVSSPPQATREHKRLIHMKLADVYLDKQQRYDRGWSDHKVATDLGVPRAWVTHERKEYFGDGEGGEDVAEYLAKVDAVLIDAERVRAAAEASRTACEQMLARLRDIERDAKALRSLVPA
jgi:hypothetical protein